MALIKCKECGHEIAKSASMCPNCGAPNKRRLGVVTKVGVVLLMLVLIGTCVKEQGLDTSDKRQQSGQPSEGVGAVATDTASLSPQSQWTYSSEEDAIAGKPVIFAEVKSTNTFEFGFPYTQPQRATLTLRKHPRWGNSAILSVERGQFLCRSGCLVTVRFDEGSPSKYSVNEPQDASTTHLFIENYPRFLTSLRKSKRARIEAQFYQEGARVLEFDIAGIEWDLTATEKSRLASVEADTVLNAAKKEARRRCNATYPDANEALECEMQIGDCMRGSTVTSARARCLSSVPITKRP